VPGETGHRDAHAAAAGDRGDDADRQAFVQQDRPLLDVRFDVRDDAAAAPVERAPASGRRRTP
jgi:hypothetical protein